MTHDTSTALRWSNSDDFAWFLLRVPPGKEATATRILENRKLLATYPTHVFRRRKHRSGKAVVEIERPSLSAYVFIAFDRSIAIPWWKVLSLPVIQSVVSVDRMPVQLSYADVWRLFAPPSFLKPQASIQRRGFSAGERVRLVDGPFAGYEGKVQDADERELVILCPMMGRETPVRVEVSSLQKVA